MFSRFSNTAIRLAALSFMAAQHTGLLAQASSSSSSAGLKEITITGNPLGATDLVAPAAQYSGEGLLLRSKTTLGETLDGTPGVGSTYFGPNASRPIIRGQDGDRIRIRCASAVRFERAADRFDRRAATLTFSGRVSSQAFHGEATATGISSHSAS